jgi:hypothetical protein
MRIRRKGRPATSGSWTPEKSARAHEAKARKRIENAPFREPELRPLPAGELLGVLQWHDASGEVKRMTVLQGSRANSIRVRGMKEDHGWDYVLRKLRAKLAIPRRTISPL